MQPVKHWQQFCFTDYSFFKIFLRHTQSGARSTGVINGMSLLGGTFRIDAQPDTFTCRLRSCAVFLHLPPGIENNVVTIFQDFLKIFLSVCRGKNMILAEPPLFRKRLYHLLSTQFCLIQSACRGAAEVLANQRIQFIHGKGLLRQQDSRTRPLHDTL